MRVWVISMRSIVWWVFICLTLGIIIGAVGFEHTPVTSSLSQLLSGRVIVIDAGHGGIDPGAVSVSGLKEKEIALAIAQELQLLLNRAAVYTVMVRDGDYDLGDPGEGNLLERKRQDLQLRVDLAESTHADLYLSIHANYFPSSIWYGAQTFYFEGQAESQQLAEAIQAELVNYLGPNHRLARPGNYRVLRTTTMPAALIEVGFLSNPREASLLAEPNYQRRIAEAIFAGVKRYFTEGS